MDEKDLPAFDFDEDENNVQFRELRSDPTETLDLSAFTGDMTTSGSFDLSGVQAKALGKLLGALPMPAFIVARSHVITFANGSSRTSQSGSVKGRDVKCLFPTDQALDVHSLIDATFLDRKARTVESIVEIDESRIWGRVHFRSVRVGKDRAVLVLVEDLTPQKKQLLLKKKHEEELQRARNELEQRAAERTAELQKTNERLLAEIAQRKRIEANLIKEERALRESEARYRTLFDESRDGIFITTTEGTIVEANPSFLNMFGYTRDELVGTNISRLYVDPSDREVYRSEIERAGSVKDYPLKLKRVDGSEMDCSATATLRRGEDGTILGYHGVMREVTDQIRTERRIKEQNSFLNSLLESVTHPFYVLDAKNHEVLMANSAARKTFHDRGATCYSLTHGRTEPCNTAHDPCPIEEVKRTRKPVTVEHIHYDSQGFPKNVEVFAYPIFDGEGNVSRIVEYAVDVSDRKRTEKALKESEERMRLVIESSPIGIAIVQDGRYLFVNRNCAKMFGYDLPDAIIGHRVEELFVPEDSEVIGRHMKGLSTDKPVRSFELKGVKTGGELFQASTWLTSLEFQGKPSWLWFLLDVSQEKGLRSQLLQSQKMEAIGTLAGGIAHDFNNLLTIILGFSEILLMDKKEGDQEYADLLKIVQAARNGADLVRRILTFSTKVETKLRPIDLNHEVKQAQKLLNRTIPKMIEIELALDSNLRKVNGDPGQIEQILLNLAVNAQHAMPDGGRLVIETKTIQLDEDYCQTHINVKPGEYAVLMVSDTGHGMEYEVLEHIFEPFYTTKKQGEGTGLGLAMVFGIVKSHGGHIVCYSEPGFGTTFKIYFPVIRMPDKAEVMTTFAIPASGTETILLVDDEEHIRDLGKKILSRAGYKVITACNGIEAIEAYNDKKNQIALVVLDLIMPQMGGRQCLEELLRIDPTVRVVVASGFSVHDLARGGLEARVGGFVSKPYRMTEMLKVVRDVLDSDV